MEPQMVTVGGYTARVERDEEEDVFVGHVEGIEDVITFEAERAEEIEAEFRASIDEYFAFCAERGIEPKRPGS